MFRSVLVREAGMANVAASAFSDQRAFSASDVRTAVSTTNRSASAATPSCCARLVRNKGIWLQGIAA